MVVFILSQGANKKSSRNYAGPDVSGDNCIAEGDRLLDTEDFRAETIEPL